MNITETGVYWNEGQFRHEAWRVNQSSGEKELLGWLVPANLDPEHEKERRRIWEHGIWMRLLGRAA